MLAADETKFLQAASDCLDLARCTQNKEMRTALLALAQARPPQNESDDNALFTALEAFTDWQMPKKHKKQ